jgi:hypothetical protein
MTMDRTSRSKRWVVLLAMLGLTAALVGARPLPVLAETDTTPWAGPTAIATGLTQAARPVLAYTPDGVGHAVWESDGKLYYATQAPDGRWSAARRIAYGMSPVLAVNEAGWLHALFTNKFMGNYEIYHISLVGGVWSLPVNVSHTSGLSAYPALAAGHDQKLYAAWMDNSPGYWTIYVGTWNSEYWSSQPAPNARGQAPALSASTGGIVYLAWQDRVPTPDNPSGSFEIFLSESGGANWSLPVNISDSLNTESIGTSLTTTADELAQLTWVEGDHEVRYCYGHRLSWSLPQTVATAAAVARGPRIVAERGMLLHIAWDEGDSVRVTAAIPAPPTWPKPTVVTALDGDLRDVSLAVLPASGIAVGWVQALEPGDMGVYESQQSPKLRLRCWLPLTARE